MKISEKIKNILAKLPISREIIEHYHRGSTILTTRDILIEQLKLQILSDLKYKDTKKLNSYEQQIYSQGGEDGIIHEIFERIGTTNKFFVEFGVSNGIECNSLNLLVSDWSGVWIEGDKENSHFISQKFNSFIEKKQLIVVNDFITRENVESLFERASVLSEPDLLSIDIDGNDYWVWKAIEKYRPRVVVVEYNASLGPWADWIMDYNPSHVWDGTSYFGVSLFSLCELGKRKGYSLVGCGLSGANAFFVRNDLLSDNFSTPFTAENHFEPARYFLIKGNGHRKDFGKFSKSNDSTS